MLSVFRTGVSSNVPFAYPIPFGVEGGTKRENGMTLKLTCMNYFPKNRKLETMVPNSMLWGARTKVI